MHKIKKIDYLQIKKLRKMRKIPYATNKKIEHAKLQKKYMLKKFARVKIKIFPYKKQKMLNYK